MTCQYQLPPGFTGKHPETTCQNAPSLARQNQNSEPERNTPEDWYERHVAIILDHLPQDSPSQQHHNQAVYWLAKAALLRLVNGFYAGEISLEGFVLCRDSLREWETTHRTEITNTGDIDETGYQSSREWAAQLVRQAVQPGSSLDCTAKK